MKALFALSLLTLTSVSLADTINNIEECNLNLRKSNPWKSKYKLNGSRITGVKASAQALTNANLGAAVEKHVDVLGNARYSTVTLVTTLESEGVSADSCEGISYANKVDVCTIDSTLKVCETFCKLEWRGLDCR